MGTAIDTRYFAPDLAEATRSSVNREGNWNTYLGLVAELRTKANVFDNLAELNAYKRECAFAYLGKRAQVCGGVCSKKPRVLSDEMIAQLAQTNRAKRYARYPWLEKLLTLMAEIERIQDETTEAQNVFSLVQSVRTIN